MLDKIIPQFFDVCDECFHFPLAWTISSDISAHPQLMIACESTQGSDWYMDAVNSGFIFSMQILSAAAFRDMPAVLTC